MIPNLIFLAALASGSMFGSFPTSSPLNAINLPLPSFSLPTSVPSINLGQKAPQTPPGFWDLGNAAIKLGKALYGLIGGLLTTTSAWFAGVTGLSVKTFFVDIWNLLLWLVDLGLKFAKGGIDWFTGTFQYLSTHWGSK